MSAGKKSAGKKAVAARRWRSILVVVPDVFSDEQPVLTKAAAVARRTGARLTLFNTFMIPSLWRTCRWMTMKRC